MIFAYLGHLFVVIGIFVLLSLALNLMLGYTGLLNLGIAALFGIGAYTSALLSLYFGIPFLLSLVIAIFVTGVLSVLIGIPSLKLRGDYLALATLGFGLIVESVFRNWRSLTRGPLGLPGIPRPNLFGWLIDTPLEYSLVLVVILVLVVFVVHLLTRSPFGRLLRGIRDDEVASLSVGKDVFRSKIVVLFIAGCIVGVAGAFYAHFFTFIDPSSFGIVEAILILSMVIIGGLESVSGSIFGAVLLILLPEPLRLVGLPPELIGPIRQLIYSLLLILLMIYRPRGFFGRYEI